jgi:hypothetical protein
MSTKIALLNAGLSLVLSSQLGMNGLGKDHKFFDGPEELRGLFITSELMEKEVLVVGLEITEQGLSWYQRIGTCTRVGEMTVEIKISGRVISCSLGGVQFVTIV